MDEMGAWMAEKGGRSAEKRVQIVVSEGGLSCGKRGINGSNCYYTREKFFPPMVAKIPSGA